MVRPIVDRVDKSKHNELEIMSLGENDQRKFCEGCRLTSHPVKGPEPQDLVTPLVIKIVILLDSFLLYKML